MLSRWLTGKESACNAVQETQEIQVQFLGWEDPLEEEMTAHSSILAWRSLWTEGCGGLQATGLQRVRHDGALTHYLLVIYIFSCIHCECSLSISVGVLVFYLWFVRSLSNYQGCFCHQHYNLLFAYMFHLRVVSVKVVFHKSNLSVLAFVISHFLTAFKFRISFPIWWISISIFS